MKGLVYQNSDELLAALSERGVQLFVTDEGLRVDGPIGSLVSEVVAAISQNKDELVATLIAAQKREIATKETVGQSPQDICLDLWEEHSEFYVRLIAEIGYVFTKDEKRTIAKRESLVQAACEAGDLPAFNEALGRWINAVQPVRYYEARERAHAAAEPRSRLARESAARAAKANPNRRPPQPLSTSLPYDPGSFTPAFIPDEDMERYLCSVEASGEMHPNFWPWLRARRVFIRALTDGLICHTYGDDRRFSTTVTKAGKAWLENRKGGKVAA